MTKSQEIVSKLDGDMSITAYVNVLSPNYSLFSFPHFIQSNRELFKQYERFKPETKLKVVYYYDTITEGDSPAYAETFANKLKKDGMTLWEAAQKGCEIYRIDSNRLKTPEEVRKMTGFDRRALLLHGNWCGKNGRRAWLQRYDDLMNLSTEAEISAAMKRMVMELPKSVLWKDMVCVLSMITEPHMVFCL